MSKSTIPDTQAGQLTFADQLIAGDVQSEADGDFVLSNPDRGELETLRNNASTELNERQALESQIQAKTESVQAAFDALEAAERKSVRVLKAVHGDTSPKLEKYGVTSAETPGQSPQMPISIESFNETAASVEIRIRGGEGAKRFSLHRRMEGQPVEDAVIAADNITASERVYVDTTIKKEKRYVYFAMAHNSFGDAGPSNEVLVTP